MSKAARALQSEQPRDQVQDRFRNALVSPKCFLVLHLTSLSLRLACRSLLPYVCLFLNILLPSPLTGLWYFVESFNYKSFYIRPVHLHPTHSFTPDLSFSFANYQRYVSHVSHLVSADDPYFILYLLGLGCTHSLVRHCA